MTYSVGAVRFWGLSSQLSPVTNTVFPSGLTASETAPSSLLTGPSWGLTHSRAPVAAR